MPGGVSGVIGYRREMRGQWRRAFILGCGTTVGALIGGILLLDAAGVRVRGRRPGPDPARGRADGASSARPSEHADTDHTTAATAASFATGIYGGYFGAAQGIILMSLLRFCLPDDLQRLNALKNVLAGVANAVAAILFIAVADVAWEAVAPDRRRARSSARRWPRSTAAACPPKCCAGWSSRSPRSSLWS